MDKIAAKMCSIFILIVIALGLLVTVNASGVAGGTKILGMTIFSEYVGSDGLQLYEFEDESNQTVINGSKLNLGGFFRDILKVQADSEIITACTNANTSFTECINKYSVENKHQKQFNRTMEHISTAVDFGQEHGIQYMSVPFIRDLLG
jgi:hypothetical protein